MELTCGGSGDRTQGGRQPGDQGGRGGAQFVEPLRQTARFSHVALL